MNKLTATFQELQKNIEKILLGKSEVIEKAISVLLAGGHLLLEDFPGVGKTTLASALARSMGGTFSRVQFTADLLPGDVLGVRVYRRSEEKFEFVQGPIFANVILADELNRAPPKTQSALLQAMNEGRVSIDRETLTLPLPFMVIATQNPRGYHGTYPLPESQRDRFMMRLSIGYPDMETEQAILTEHRETDPLQTITAVITLDQVAQAQKEARTIKVSEPCLAYLSRLANATRDHPDVLIPLSPRAMISLMHAAQGMAYLRDQEWVDIDIIKTLAPNVLAHRMNLRSLGQSHVGEGAPTAWVINELLKRIPVE